MNQLGIRSDFFQKCAFFPEGVRDGVTSFETLAVMEVDLGEGDVGIEWVENPEHANYWSVYARHTSGEAYCVADLKTAEQASTLKSLLEKALNTLTIPITPAKTSDS